MRLEAVVLRVGFSSPSQLDLAKINMMSKGAAGLSRKIIFNMWVSAAVYNFLTDFLVCFPLLCCECSSLSFAFKESLVLVWAQGVSLWPAALSSCLPKCCTQVSGFGCTSGGIFFRLRTRAEPLLYVTSCFGHQVLLHFPQWLRGVESHSQPANVPYLTVPVQSNGWHLWARCQRNRPCNQH